MSAADDAGLALLGWQARDLPRAVQDLAIAAGLTEPASQSDLGWVGAPASRSDPGWADGEALAGRLATAGMRIGVEVVAVEATFGRLEVMLQRLGPALLRFGSGEAARYLGVVRGGRWGVTLLGPDGERRRVETARVALALSGDRLAPAEADMRSTLTELGWDIDEGGLQALARERLQGVVLDGGWLIRTAPGNRLRRQLAATSTPLLFGLMLVTRVASVALTLWLWRTVGGALLAGDITAEATSTAALCLVGMAPLAVLDAWTQGRLALEAGAQIKESLLYGLLRLDRGATRKAGIGHFMSMAMEGEVASTAIESALRLLSATIDLTAGMVVLLLGAEGHLLAPLLLGWLGVVGWLCWRHALAASRWADAYRDITHDLVERMVGYQTRLVQEPPELRHLDEDALLADYVAASQTVDRFTLAVNGVVRPGWLLLGLAVLTPTLLADAASEATAVAFGGVLLVAGALQRVVGGVASLVDAWVSWRQTAPIFAAGRAGWQRDAAVPAEPAYPRDERPGAPLVRAAGLTVRHDPRRPEALRGCTLAIAAGERVLLEGPSGSGKSTLATVLAGLRPPDGGELWCLGQRRSAVIDERWRRRVALVPQFHDNHVLAESLLFNLLLGRDWPPTADDKRDAAAMCERLGLTPLLQRMPQGLQQTVGEGGWALSHGERSRVFLARALLQRDVALVILDESFAALDPETLREIGRGVLAAAPTLLVIAHR